MAPLDWRSLFLIPMSDERLFCLEKQLAIITLAIITLAIITLAIITLAIITNDLNSIIATISICCHKPL